MTVTDAHASTGVPSAVHIGADELPFVDLGGGNLLKVIQVRAEEGLWIIENIFQNGFERADAPPHRTGVRATRCRARGSTRSTTT